LTKINFFGGFKKRTTNILSNQIEKLHKKKVDLLEESSELRRDEKTENNIAPDH
jgi:hypothetical protein